MTMSKQPSHPIGSGDDITTRIMTVIHSRKDGGSDTNTSTMAEQTKKRPYKREDCGSDTNTSAATKKRKDCGSDTSTSTVTETKERPYKRNDCGSDTDTSTVMKRRRDCGSDTETSTVMKKRKDCGGDTTSIPAVMNYLPHDLIMEQILTKLPVPTLLKSVLVSKLWYNSILNDNKRLTYSHFLESQKQPQVILSLLNVRGGVIENTGEPRYDCHFFRFTNGITFNNIKNVLEFQRFRGGPADRDIWELVGYCNGLPCLTHVRKHSTVYIILDPNRKDFIYIYYPAKVGRRCISESRIICHGFGFDPTAKEYKLVSIFCTPQKELNFLVFTLGTKSWRNVTPTSMPISHHGGRPILKIRAPTGSDKSGIFCTTSSSSGSLAWKIIATLAGAGSNSVQHDNNNDVSNDMEMLLLFNLHDEKFQFIQLPAKSTTEEQQKHSIVDYPHLLGFKGSPCIARIEKISENGSDCPHRCRDDHQGISSCCCCCKVHLYILKDNVKQEWVKEKSFDVRIKPTLTWAKNMAPDPCCFCFGSTTTPPTRILSFSDQMLLYWFSGKYLQVYNLNSGKLQLVVPASQRLRDILRSKREEPRHKFHDDIYFSNTDYQLHCHEENFLSLQTFIPEGVEGVDADEFSKLDLRREDRPCSAYVLIYRGSKVYYPFFTSTDMS